MRCIRQGLCCPTKSARLLASAGRGPRGAEASGRWGAGGTLPETPEQKYRLIYLSAPWRGVAVSGLPVFLLPPSYCSPAHLPRGDAEAKMCFILPNRQRGDVASGRWGRRGCAPAATGAKIPFILPIRTHGRLCTGRGAATVTRCSRSRGTEDHTIRPSVVLATGLDRPLAALGDHGARQGEGGGARLCPSRGALRALRGACCSREHSC